MCLLLNLAALMNERFPGENVNSSSPCINEDNMADKKPSSPRIKEEHCSWEEYGSAHVALSTSPTEYPAACFKEEPCLDNDGILDLSISKAHPQRFLPDPPRNNRFEYLTSHIEHKEGFIPPVDQNLGSDCSTPLRPLLCIKEEVESGEDNLEEGVEYTTICIKEEPISGDEGDIPPTDIPGGLQDHSALNGDKESDTYHTQIEYTTVRIKGEESSDEDYEEVIPDPDNYATRDHTYMVMRTDDRMKAPCNTRKLHKTLNCSECGKVFFGKAAYRLHQRLHRGEAVYACSICGKKFSRKGSCEKHQEAAHSREKSFECDNCDRYFSSKLGLTLHRRVHTREPTFACKDCAKSFTSNSALIQHQRVHYTDRRLVCTKCGKTFDNKSDLINHEILHPVQQSFMCSECGEKFLTKAELSAHWKVHTVIKAFSWRKIRFTHQETRATEDTAHSAAEGQ